MVRVGFVTKKFSPEANIQVGRLLRTKSLESNPIFSLRGKSVVFTNTDLKPLNNNLQRIKLQFSRVITYKEF